MHLKGVHDRCVLIQNEQINVMLLIIIISPGLRSFDENTCICKVLFVWNLDVCTFITFLGYVGVEEDMLSRGGCILTCIFNSIFFSQPDIDTPTRSGTLKLHTRIFKHDTSR